MRREGVRAGNCVVYVDGHSGTGGSEGGEVCGICGQAQQDGRGG